MQIILFSILFLGQFACHHRMKIVSNPDGAKLYRNTEYLGTTPYELSFWWLPFRKDELHFSLSGHHSLTMPLRYPFYRVGEDLVQLRIKRLVGLAPNEHRVILFQKEKSK